MMIYTDAQAEVHVGDTVRYVRYDYRNQGKFLGRTGTVVDANPRRPGSVGIHFPHHAKGMNVLAVAEEIRLVACPHEDRRYGNDD
jgi:hypothetical protein